VREVGHLPRYLPVRYVVGCTVVRMWVTVRSVNCFCIDKMARNGHKISLSVCNTVDSFWCSMCRRTVCHFRVSCGKFHPQTVALLLSVPCWVWPFNRHSQRLPLIPAGVADVLDSKSKWGRYSEWPWGRSAVVGRIRAVAVVRRCWLLTAAKLHVCSRHPPGVLWRHWTCPAYGDVPRSQQPFSFTYWNSIQRFKRLGRGLPRYKVPWSASNGDRDKTVEAWSWQIICVWFWGWE
jgi:hypothetical protein